MANLGFQADLRHPGARRASSSSAPSCPTSARTTRVRSLESGRALSSFDVVAFSISFETDYVHLLDVLAAAGLPLRARRARRARPADRRRRPGDLPEPRADRRVRRPLPDRRGRGDGAGVARGAARRRARGGGDRGALLDASVDGRRAPTCRARWAGFASARPATPAPRVRRRYVARLDDAPTRSQILAPDAVFGDMFLVEASRGCEWGCRFCAAGFMYRPVRHRSARVAARGRARHGARAPQRRSAWSAPRWRATRASPRCAARSPSAAVARRRRR